MHIDEKTKNVILSKRAATVGGSQTLSKRPETLGDHYPRYTIGGQGSLLIGCSPMHREHQKAYYTDFICGLGAVSLGYGIGADEIYHDLKEGVSFSTPHALEFIVADELVSMLRWPDQVRWCKTGSEACAGAVRIMRMATGRERILVCGYHGWHDWYTASKPRRFDKPGIPRALDTLVEAVPYNNLLALEQAFADPNVAGIIMEPTLIDPPQPQYLQDVVELAHRHGALVTFDEMICGFRWAIGGGGEYFDVEPDLATFGKGMANGAPLAAIVGKQQVMQHAWVCSGTFSGEIFGLASARYVLSQYRRHDITAHMKTLGTDLMDGWNGVLAKHHVNQWTAHVTGQPFHPVLYVDEFYRKNFFSQVAHHGVLLHPNGCNIMYAHRPEDVVKAVLAVEDAITAVITSST